MPDFDYDAIRESFESGDSDPYIPREAIESLPEVWDSYVDDGYGDLAVIFESFDVDPGDITGVSVEFDGDSWSLELSDGTTIELGEDAPDWVWDELYDLADEYDWYWEVEYGED